MNPPNDPNNPAPPPQSYPPPGQGYPPPGQGYAQPQQGYPQQPGVWPPPPGGAYDPNMTMGNTSGGGPMAPIPPELAALKWNWGAALLAWLWCLNHKMVGWGVGILLLSFIPYVGSLVHLAAFVYFGLNGHKLGWQNRRFEGGLPEYFAVQNAWMKWGIGLIIVSFVIGIIAGLMGGLATVLSGMHPHGGTSSP